MDEILRLLRENNEMLKLINISANAYVENWHK